MVFKIKNIIAFNVSTCCLFLYIYIYMYYYIYIYIFIYIFCAKYARENNLLVIVRKFVYLL